MSQQSVGEEPTEEEEDEDEAEEMEEDDDDDDDADKDNVSSLSWFNYCHTQETKNTRNIMEFCGVLIRDNMVAWYSVCWTGLDSRSRISRLET